MKASLISTVVVFKSFLNTLQKIADAAFNTKGLNNYNCFNILLVVCLGSSTDIGGHLGLIASSHRAMVGHVETVIR